MDPRHSKTLGILSAHHSARWYDTRELHGLDEMEDDALVVVHCTEGGIRQSTRVLVSITRQGRATLAALRNRATAYEVKRGQH